MATTWILSGYTIGLKMKSWTQEALDLYEKDLQALHNQGAFNARVGVYLTVGRKPEV